MRTRIIHPWRDCCSRAAGASALRFRCCGHRGGENGHAAHRSRQRDAFLGVGGREQVARPGQQPKDGVLRAVEAAAGGQLPNLQ